MVAILNIILLFLAQALTIEYFNYDIKYLKDCMTGPGKIAKIKLVLEIDKERSFIEIYNHDCGRFDIDGDGDIDLKDYQYWQMELNPK